MGCGTIYENRRHEKVGYSHWKLREAVPIPDRALLYLEIRDKTRGLLVEGVHASSFAGILSPSQHVALWDSRFQAATGRMEARSALNIPERRQVATRKSQISSWQQ